MVLYFKKFYFHAQLLTAMRVVLINMDDRGNIEKSGKNILAEMSRMNSSVVARGAGVEKSAPQSK